MLRSEAGVPFAAGKPVLIADTAAIARAFTDLKSLHIQGTHFRVHKGDAIIDVATGWFSADLLDQGP